jgi:hypothetical protein
MQLSRRKFLRGISMTGAAVQIGLPPLAAMFNMNGTAYAAEPGKVGAIDKRFVIWWNGNGIPERYWIPRETGENYELTACLSPLGRVRDYVHVLSGVDNVAARLNGQGNGHFSALCGLMTGTVPGVGDRIASYGCPDRTYLFNDFQQGEVWLAEQVTFEVGENGFAVTSSRMAPVRRVWQ